MSRETSKYSQVTTKQSFKEKPSPFRNLQKLFQQITQCKNAATFRKKELIS